MRTVTWTANVAAAILIALALFQFLLALGLPLGAAAWGGQQRTLSIALRAASLASVGIYILAIMTVRTRAGLQNALPGPRVARYGIWVFAGIFLLSGLANIASPSPWERWLWGPVALFLSLLCLVLARKP